ncbi:MAG TPA: hypothetical protein PKD55_09615 [Bellilinea sp.]|nr:hypothetical protein [Bellilinea sp.]
MGKVDIVLGAANPSSLASRMQRQNRTPTPIAGIEAVVLSCLFVKRGLTIETVARRSGLGKKDIEHALVKLVEWELCSQPTTTTYLRSPLSNQFAYLVSIEGKLTNWRKALEQASRNRLFASYSYVVMDARRAKPAIERNALFRAHGVGLAVACAKTQSVEIICRPIPPHKPVSDVFSVIAKEALTARVLKREVFLSENFTHALSAQH